MYFENTLDDALADATICKVGESYVLATTKMTSTRKDALLMGKITYIHGAQDMLCQ